MDSACSSAASQTARKSSACEQRRPQGARFSIISYENITDPEQIVMTQLPIIDLRAPEREIAQQIAEACRAH